MSWGNASAVVEQNKVVALVRGDDRNKHLIRYTLGATSITDEYTFH